MMASAAMAAAVTVLQMFNEDDKGYNAEEAVLNQ